MSSARQWFGKRVHPGPKDPLSPVSEKHSLHADRDVKSPRSFKFNTLAAAMTRKSKKSHTPLPMQDQPPLPPLPPHNASKYATRLPSKPVSPTIRSGDGPVQPQTPTDGPRDRLSFPLSIMTLSDPDPFSAKAFAVPKGNRNRNGLVLFSSPSVADIVPKETATTFASARTSFTSASSHPHHPYSPLSPVSPKFPSPSDQAKSSLKTLPEQLDHRDVFPPQEGSLRIQTPAVTRRSSTATLTDKSPVKSTPRIRPRRCTEATSHSTPSLSHVHRKTPTPPMYDPKSIPALPRSPTIHREVSVRVAAEPPCAPPPHALPAVPIPCDTGDDSVSNDSHQSSSGISFASSASHILDDNDDYLDPRYRIMMERPMTADRESVTSGMPVYKDILLKENLTPPSTANCPPSSSGHSLKKSLSHSTLQKCMATWLPPSPSSSDANAADREPRKQRSFHHSRNQPPPLRHVSSCTPSTSARDSPDSHRGPPSSPPVTRKRLFSGSSQRRPSTATTEDDLRSIFSLPSEIERSQAAVPLHSAQLNEGHESDAAPHGAPLAAPTEYAQQIMSPAEMFALEAKVQSEFEGKHGEPIRNRQHIPASILVTPQHEPFVRKGPNTAPSSFNRFGARTFPNGSLDLPAPQLNVRPSTAQELPHSSSSLLSVQSRPSTGLPLPSQPNFSRPHTAESSYSKTSHAPCVAGNRASNVFTPLSPPPRRPPTRVVVNREEPQRLMIRKPSFLDINDEPPSMEDSFLDLGGGKGSLDLSPAEDDEDDDEVFVH